MIPSLFGLTKGDTKSVLLVVAVSFFKPLGFSKDGLFFHFLVFPPPCMTLHPPVKLEWQARKFLVPCVLLDVPSSFPDSYLPFRYSNISL